MLQESLALCGRMIKPPALKLRSTGADEARTHKAWFATLKRAEYSSDFLQIFSVFLSKNPKYLKATQSLLKLLPSIFLAVPLVLDMCYWLFLACSGGYSMLGARDKDFQNLMFSKKYGFDLVFPFFLTKSW